MTRTYNFNAASLNPWAIGFETLFDRLNGATDNSHSNYPPYNIIKHDAYKYCIEIAVAGFTRDELKVELAEGVLILTADSHQEDATEYVHRGLAKRAFARSWTLSDDVVVQSVSLENGVLAISLERVIPEEKKPKKFDIL